MARQMAKLLPSSRRREVISFQKRSGSEIQSISLLLPASRVLSAGGDRRKRITCALRNRER